MESAQHLLGTVLVFISIAAFGASTITSSVTSEPDETVTVTALPFGRDAAHIAQPVTVLRGEELHRKQAGTIGETLNRELGVSSTSFGPGASRPLIRGLGGSRVRVLEGGVGSMDVSNLSDDHAVSIDPLRADQVEILKGPATLLYGSGAIGGVVNLVTNRIPSALVERPTGQLDFSYEEATNGFAGGGTLDAAFKQFAVHLDGVRRSTSDYDIPGFGLLDPPPGTLRGKLFNSDTDTDNVAGGGSYVGGRGYLGFSIGHYASNYGIPADEARRIDLTQDRYDIAGELANPLPGFSKFKLRMGHNDYLHQELTPEGDVGTTFLNDEYEGRVELTHEALANFIGVVGVQVQHRDFAAVGDEQLTPPVSARSVGVFAVEARDWGPFHLEFGARYENTDYEPALPTNPARTFDVYSLSGGTGWKFMEGYSVGASFTRGQRAPGIEELYNNGPHDATQSFELGDPSLQEETANNLDFTLRKLDGRLTWQLNLFGNYIQDFVFANNVDANGDGIADHLDEEGALVPGTDGFLLLAYAQDDAEFYGAEFETTLGLVRDSPYGELDLRLFTDFVRGQLTNGNDLPRITPLRFGAGLDYRYAAWTADFDVRRVVEQDNTAPLETVTSGYTLVGVGVSYTLPSSQAEYVISLRGTNLLDEEIRYHTSLLKDFAPQPGRSAMLALRVSF